MVETNRCDLLQESLLRTEELYLDQNQEVDILSNKLKKRTNQLFIPTTILGLLVILIWVK